MKTIINVANRLPVTIEGEQIKKSSGGLVSALDGVAGREYQLKRIGWPGKAGDDPQIRQSLETRLRDELGYWPVFLDADQVEGFYEGFSNSSLWPLLHYMPSKFRYQRQWWEAYRAVNQRFCRAVLEIAREDDLVWVHDYHLFLLPAMLKQEMPSLKIGFFLHTPFPSVELFRLHPNRQELLAGMLGADQIGFHTFHYLRHFRSCLLRLLGIDSEMTRVHPDGRVSYLGVYPIGINAPRTRKTLESPECLREIAELRQTHQGKRIILSVERLDYTKGILHRIEAIDLFLEQCKAPETLRFIFISVPSREEVREYKDLREEVEYRVGRLNGKYSTLHSAPVHFIHGSIDFTRLCAIYSLAEVALVTPLIDGMNLVAKEFVACQGKEPGVLVLSEFAGAAEELFNATLVNPYDPQGVADALRAALEMPPQERAERMAPMIERVMTFDAAWWARTFIGDLQSRPEASAQPAVDRRQLMETQQKISQALQRGSPVAFFLDYDGTLREIERDPDAARPTTAIRELLDRFHEIPNLDVAIITGRRARDMDLWFADPAITVIAEHGAEIRRPGSGEWEQLDRHLAYEWKPEVLKVLRQYADSTPGSFVEQKRTGLVWHYRKAEPEFAEWKANQLAEELQSALANQPVQIRRGKKIVEVMASDISKAAAVARLMQEKPYVLALCAGDDQTDESMFKLSLANLITIKVGWGETAAQLRISSPQNLRRFLLEALPVVTRVFNPC